MKEIYPILKKFLSQAHTDNLKVNEFPKEWAGFQLRVSFGQGQPARIPWIAFLSPEMKVTRGIYPVYLYYKTGKVLILAYGVSETEEPEVNWPVEVQNSATTIENHFKGDIPRYGSSFIFKSYSVIEPEKNVSFFDVESNKEAREKDINDDLSKILGVYEGIVSKAPVEPGLFYMEKQLEDFLIENWNHTELGREFDLIIEEGVLVSQQFKTEIGPIDILARDKKTGDYVVIELKKNQTSDDTVGQIARYVGWVKKHKSDGKGVKGIIIAGSYDKKLDYALKAFEGLDLDVYLYKVDFSLKEFGR